MSDGMGREPAYLSSHATNRYFIPNWGKIFGNMEILPFHQKSTGMMFFLRFFIHAKSFTYFCKP